MTDRFPQHWLSRHQLSFVESGGLSSKTNAPPRTTPVGPDAAPLNGPSGVGSSGVSGTPATPPRSHSLSRVQGSRSARYFNSAGRRGMG